MKKKTDNVQPSGPGVLTTYFIKKHRQQEARPDGLAEKQPLAKQSVSGSNPQSRFFKAFYFVFLVILFVFLTFCNHRCSVCTWQLQLNCYAYTMLCW